MHRLASSTTYAVRLLPDRVDALENRGYPIEKADIFLHAVLWGTAPISWRTARLFYEMRSLAIVTSLTPVAMDLVSRLCSRLPGAAARV